VQRGCRAMEESDDILWVMCLSLIHGFSLKGETELSHILQGAC